jgi:aminopeptidase-like protein
LPIPIMPILVVHAINLDNIDEMNSASVVIENANNMYMSEKNIYISYSEYINEWEIRTDITKNIILEILDIIDKDYIPKRQFKGPIFLSGCGLWVDWRENRKLNQNIEQITLRLEGDKSVFDIAEELDMEFNDVLCYVNKFLEKGLVKKIY